MSHRWIGARGQRSARLPKGASESPNRATERSVIWRVLLRLLHQADQLATHLWIAKSGGVGTRDRHQRLRRRSRVGGDLQPQSDGQINHRSAAQHDRELADDRGVHGTLHGADSIHAGSLVGSACHVPPDTNHGLPSGALSDGDGRL